MDEKIFRFLDKKIKLGDKLNFGVIDLLFLAFLTGAAVTVRLTLFPAITEDFEGCLSLWMDRMHQHGGFPALRYEIGDYTPPYLYFLAAASYLPLDNLGAVKLVGLVFDFACAAVMFWGIWTLTGSSGASLIAYGTTLFLPSVLFNGPLWGQCDVLYTLFLVLSLLGIVRGKPFSACLFFGIAFSIKLQAIFFFPVLVFCWLLGKLKLKYFLVIPAAYLASLLPALLAKRNLWEMLTVYFRQMKLYTDALTYQMPNAYALTGGYYREELAGAGVVFTLFLLVLMAYGLYKKRPNLTKESLLCLTVFTILLMNFFLPFMHERYAFAADIIALALFLWKKNYLWLLVSTQLLTLLSYQSFLFQNVVLPLQITALFYLVLLCLLGTHLYRRICQENKPPIPQAAPAPL